MKHGQWRTRIRRLGSVRVALTVVSTLALVLTGCAGPFRVYNEDKSKFATGIKDKYTKAEVLGAIEVEKRNLDNMLAEELKVVREHQQLAVDSALLRIADDGTPMAATYAKKARPRITALGFDGFKGLRDYRIAAVTATEQRRNLQALAIRIRRLAQVPAPPCDSRQDLPDTLAKAVTVPDSVDSGSRDAAEELYTNYRRVCGGLTDPEQRGLLRSTRAEWIAAEAEAAAIDQTLQAARADLAVKTKAHEDAVAAQKEAAGAAASVKEDLQKRAADALKALNAAKEAVSAAESKDGGVLTARLDALVTVLSAAAGGSIDTTDQDLKKAATVAKEIPSLAGDMDALLKQAKAPPVNGLLLEMRHQMLLLEQVKQLRTLNLQRVDILKARYDALQEEARLWLRFSDAMCSYGMLKSGATELPSAQTCDTFADAPNITCTVGSTRVDPCRLEKPWNENIRARVDEVATRELYKALAAYLQALAIQATEHEQTFRLIDVSHREALVTREAALRQWDNLIAVPISQLDAYYQAGLKPAEIADLIVKALGFTAIAVGVSR